jgi:hypothetical protein
MLIDNAIDRLMGNQCFHNIMMREQLSSERTPVISEYQEPENAECGAYANSMIRKGRMQAFFGRILT